MLVKMLALIDRQANFSKSVVVRMIVSYQKFQSILENTQNDLLRMWKMELKESKFNSPSNWPLQKIP